MVLVYSMLIAIFLIVIILFNAIWKLYKTKNMLVNLDKSACNILRTFYPVGIKNKMYVDFKLYNYYRIFSAKNRIPDNFTPPSWLPCLYWLEIVRDKLLLAGGKKVYPVLSSTGKSQRFRKILICKQGLVQGKDVVLILDEVATEMSQDASYSFRAEPIRIRPTELKKLMNRLLLVEYEESLEWNVPIRINEIETTPFNFSGEFDSSDGAIRRIIPKYKESYEDAVKEVKYKTARRQVNWHEEFYGMRSCLFELGRG